MNVNLKSIDQNVVRSCKNRGYALPLKALEPIALKRQLALISLDKQAERASRYAQLTALAIGELKGTEVRRRGVTQHIGLRGPADLCTLGDDASRTGLNGAIVVVDLLHPLLPQSPDDHVANKAEKTQGRKEDKYENCCDYVFH